MTRQEFVSTLNEWGGRRVPFLFLVDFEMTNPLAFPLDEIDPSSLLFEINGFTNTDRRTLTTPPRIVRKEFISFPDYQKRFNTVWDRLRYGDSYLTNLTTKTEVTLSHSLLDIFHASSAKYKLYFQDKFVVFSPECFVRIENDRIYSYPMKGTIDAAVSEAAAVILSDKKELAEHVTIVDLIRNDISQIATNVEVTRFRYIEEIRTREKNLLQVSSEIRGELPSDYRERLGDLLMALLPAGSVSGAPKEKTIEIIREAEMENRGYYTGVFGYFNGDRLDSGVMIRYIERSGERCFYRSGGGITTQSSAGKEYQEIIDKVYVPVA
jgi:para-aminobenzoate synthetase component I